MVKSNAMFTKKIDSFNLEFSMEFGEDKERTGKVRNEALGGRMESISKRSDLWLAQSNMAKIAQMNVIESFADG